MIHLGTSGYSYGHWRRIFYPRGLPPTRWLAHYARIFRSVELNGTFYRLPVPGAARGWSEATPASFVFAAKGSRYLTHMKRLTDAAQGLDRYFERLHDLRRKLRVVLWQLPPQMNHADPARLRAFLRELPRRGLRHAFEFRSEGWYTREICDVLDEFDTAFCEHDLVRAQPPRITGGFRYLRFHGATGKYSGRYGKRALRPFARSLSQFRGDAFVYFNNDIGGHALRDALDLASLLPFAHAVRSGGSPSRAAARRSEAGQADGSRSGL